MSIDMADDLHAAEDRIGVLEAALRSALDLLAVGPPAPTDPECTSKGMKRRQVIVELLAIAAEGFCRPSCEDPETCDDECCGCACHNDD